MTTASKTKTQTMFALVDQWKTSGVTQKTFCAEQNINIHTLINPKQWLTYMLAYILQTKYTDVQSLYPQN